MEKKLVSEMFHYQNKPRCNCIAFSENINDKYKE